MKGYVHVYTGDGKGKTTAAFGLALRAVGAGMKVYIAQFVKGMEYSELHVIEKFEGQIVLKQFGRDCFIYKDPEEADIEAAREGLEESRKAIQSGQYQMVILDEANIATFYNLFSVDELLELINNKPDEVEIIITGRRADQKIIDTADLVTEMREIKHYYRQGVEARKGIEM